jgi:glyoxylase-like metal-dependent hydrolase (beta-lactamase superfamily II)
MEILPGIHWLQAGYANVYLCVEDAGLTLVDSGTPKQAGKILNYVGGLGRAPEELRQICITHADFDHAGSVAELQRLTGATVYASSATAEYLRRGRAPQHLPRILRPITNFLNRYAAVAPQALVEVPAGTALPVLGELHLLATPGHTPEHHSFYSPSRGVLFAGDALGTRGGKLGLSPPFITADVEAARRSARWLLRLAPVLFACGHGEPLPSPGDASLARFRSELEQH